MPINMSMIGQGPRLEELTPCRCFHFCNCPANDVKSSTIFSWASSIFSSTLLFHGYSPLHLLINPPADFFRLVNSDFDFAYLIFCSPFLSAISSQVSLPSSVPFTRSQQFFFFFFFKFDGIFLNLTNFPNVNLALLPVWF